MVKKCRSRFYTRRSYLNCVEILKMHVYNVRIKNVITREEECIKLTSYCRPCQGHDKKTFNI